MHCCVHASRQYICTFKKKNAVFCSFAANVFRRERNCFKPAAKNPRIRNVDATIVTVAVPTRVFGPLSSKESKHKQFLKIVGLRSKTTCERKCLYICLMKKYFYCKFQSKLETDVHPNENQNSLLTSCEDVTYLCFEPRKVKKKHFLRERTPGNHSFLVGPQGVNAIMWISHVNE